MSKAKLLFLLTSLVVVSTLIGGTMWAANQRDEDDGRDSLYKYLAVFTEVLGLVDRAYVDELESEPLMAGAFEGALDALDPFSLYVPAKYSASFETTLEVGNRRSGLTVLKERGVVFVVAVEDGSPADAAGLQIGDVISLIDGLATRMTPLFEVQAIFAGDPGKTIELERIRFGQKSEVVLELGEYARPGFSVEQSEGVAILRIGAFEEEALEHCAAALRGLSTETLDLGEISVADRLILDLRGIAGGDERVAYRLADLFSEGSLGALRTRDDDVESFESSKPPVWQGRLAILVDRGTQGAAEVLATVLRQNVSATLVGDRSFGYSGRRASVELSNGARLLITDAFFTGPDREPIVKGLSPDRLVRKPIASNTEELTDEADPVLEEALLALAEDEPKAAAA